MKHQICVALMGLLAVWAFAAPTANYTAEPCDATTCVLPDCRCSSTKIPGGLASDEIPHFVVLSFDDGVTITNHPFYQALQERINPNGCKYQMTFFVSHENSNYSLVNDLHRNGHEIAVHSVTHKSDVQNYWRPMDKQGWANEMNDMRDMLEKYALIPPEDIKGFRAPFLEVGGNAMYQALEENGFEYDCSWPSLQFTPWFEGTDGTVNGTLWPYTLDYASTQDQTIGTKPTESIAGLWVSPMTDLVDNRGVECSMLDGCESDDNELEEEAGAVTALLKRNFNYHFGERTPYGIYTHHAWFLTDQSNNNNAKHDGFEQFLDYLEAFNWVYVVSVEQLLAWVKDPVPASEMKDHPAFQCSSNLPTNNCAIHKNCNYTAPLPISQEEVFMNVCGEKCPTYYPWLGNIDGEDQYVAPIDASKAKN